MERGRETSMRPRMRLAFEVFEQIRRKSYSVVGSVARELRGFPPQPRAVKDLTLRRPRSPGRSLAKALRNWGQRSACSKAAASAWTSPRWLRQGHVPFHVVSKGRNALLKTTGLEVQFWKADSFMSRQVSRGGYLAPLFWSGNGSNLSALLLICLRSTFHVS